MSATESARQTLDRLHGELAAFVAEAAQRLDVPGVAVGVLLGGEEDYVNYGVTSLDIPLPVDEDTLFQIGSTTKTYTGTAIMALVERGLVDLDAPVRRYLPDFRLQDEHAAANVTVGQLLNHTAGWAGDFSPDTGYGDDALARFVARMVEAKQERPLGERVSYNNAALCVAGRVIEVVTGQTYEAAVKELVLDPIGLTQHFFFPWDIMTRKFAAGHARRGGELHVTPWYESRAGHPPGSEFSATARDQLRYARFHLGDGAGVLSRATLERMQTPTTPAAPDGHGEVYGVAWHLGEIGGVKTVSHGGSCRGHQSAFEMIPERQFAFAALTNASHGTALLTELVAWAFESYAGVAEPLPEPLALSEAELAAYAATFTSHTGDLTLTVEGDHLHAVMAINPELMEDLGVDADEEPIPPFTMRILPDNEFLIADGQYKGLRGAILRDDTGRVTGLDLGRVFTRVE